MIRSRSDMIRLAREAISRSVAPVDLEQLDDEDLALVVTGNIQSLSPERRDLALRAIIAHPEIGALVRDLSTLYATQSNTSHRLLWTLRATQSFLAMAACTMLTFFVWRVIDAPAVLPKSRDPLAAPPAMHWRDDVLIAALIVTIVTAIALLVLRKRRRK